MKTITILGALALVGCAAEPTKQDISQPQFDVADDKDDSPRKPSKGVDLRIAQLGQGTFDRTRGFISHEVRLDAGPVDLDLVGDGQPLDTILYVFGPRRANGTYPAHALAFNDDADYPHNLGSHLVLDVATAGTYRMVVSTYDNYVSYPSHVSVADYRVIVKCQNPTFGGCGPAVSGIDGACWADDDCMAVDGAPLHCEGEVTCAPGTNCLFTREGRCVADVAWMTYAPVQCSSPWGAAVLTEDEEAQYPIPELAKVVKHYAKLGIVIDEVGTLMKPDPLLTCAACGCARGLEIAVKLTTPMAAELAALGWTYSSSDPPEQALEPAQCGSNPWQTTATTDVYAELEQVDSWLAANSVMSRKRGFAWPTEPRVTCAACSCARGDRLLVYAPDLQAHGILQSLGFDFLYMP
ncbi:MAG: hypothetical protein H0T89_29340 [Deltaproteobacteria bacterium]|nr:hypothetical protein [Deltaproteobacteria bacterium]MDQ3297212.1 hypothetical protein [Myxococcota bacterium]